MSDIGNMAETGFQAQQSVRLSSGTLTIRAATDKLNAFNATLKDLLAGKSQVLLDVKLLQVVHNNLRNTGITPPQQITAFNVYTEEQAILSQNQQLVQEIISSGLAAPGDTLTILGILLASGQVTSPIFQNGVVLFGGGLTLTGLSPGPVKINLNLNSSESRELDQIQMHLGDGEEGTLKSGSRYPIETSQYSDLGTSGINIPGLTSAGASGKPRFPSVAIELRWTNNPADRVSGPGPDVQSHSSCHPQRRSCTDHGYEAHCPGKLLY